MKHKHFYMHLIETTDITLELANLEISKEERVHLLSLIDANIHIAVMEAVLSELPKEDKRHFLKNLSLNDHDKTWLHLRQKNKDIEEKIKKVIDNTLKELLKDVSESKDQKSDNK